MTRTIDSLTGLRIVAALIVFMVHIPTPESLEGTPVDTFMRSGYSGVTLFFVLSGFVLTRTYADRLAEPTAPAVRNFAVARAARILPLYFAALLFTVLQSDMEVPPGAWLHLFTLQTWSGNLETAWGLNTPGWSIGVETFLYALCPLFLWLVVPLSTRKVAGVLIGSVAVLTLVTAAFYVTGGHDLPASDPASANRWLYRTPLTRVPDFLIGVTLALIVMRSKGPNRWAPAVQWAAVIVTVVLMSSSTVRDAAYSYDLVYAIVYGALIWSLAMADQAPVARLLSTPLVVRGGLISYAFYLFHVPIIVALEPDPGLIRTWVLTVGAALMLSLLAAAGAHAVIEVPAQRWIRHRFSTPEPRASIPDAGTQNRPASEEAGRMERVDRSERGA